MDYELLSRSPVFRGLNPQVIAGLLSQVNCRVRKYQPGKIIAISGEEVTTLQIVISGMVKGEMVDFAGRVVKIEDIGAPRALAPAFLFGSRNSYPVNVVAVTEAEILIIEKHDFIKLLTREEALLASYLDTISNRSQFLSEKIRFFTFRTIRGKLAHYILEKAGQSRSRIRFGRTQQELAEFFGIARPSLSRALREMADDGLIEASGKEITILDRERLVALTVD